MNKEIVCSHCGSRLVFGSALLCIFLLLLLLAKINPDTYTLGVLVAAPVVGALVVFRLLNLGLETTWSLGVGIVCAVLFVVLWVGLVSDTGLTDTGYAIFSVLNAFLAYLLVRNKRFD